MCEPFIYELSTYKSTRVYLSNLFKVLKINRADVATNYLFHSCKWIVLVSRFIKLEMHLIKFQWLRNMKQKCNIWGCLNDNKTENINLDS